MEDGQLAIFALIILFIIGGFVPFVMASFIESDTYVYDGYLAGFIGFVQNGVNLGFTLPVPFFPDVPIDFNFNPFSWLGANMQNFIVNQLQGFSLIPTQIGIPLLIIMAFAMLYSIVKLVKPFS